MADPAALKLSWVVLQFAAPPCPRDHGGTLIALTLRTIGPYYDMDWKIGTQDWLEIVSAVVCVLSLVVAGTTVLLAVIR